jgi:transglutaminase-like putative cysteine protease
MIAAPAIDQHRPWLNYEALASNLAPAHPDVFDWSQRYGPLHWPRTGHEVFDVQAKHPDYWKTENLDLFNGRGWQSADVGSADPEYAVDNSAIAEWSQTLHVTLRAMKTNNVIAAGVAEIPDHAGLADGGSSPGTWTISSGLGPGDSYTVRVYSPHPTASELEDAGSDYQGAVFTQYLTLQIPLRTAVDPQGLEVPPGLVPPRTATVSFPIFGMRPNPAYGAETLAELRASPYAQAYTLAQRLKRSAGTPYDFVMSVKNYLSHGFSYNENPPASTYPIETFLFNSKRGYCQQFAGAMALLLRMGGVPARVSTGFTTGLYSSATHSYVVSDVDAHAWVEAWFPRYGWVRFDPTPAAAPALGGHVSLLPVKNLSGLTGHTSPGIAGRTIKDTATGASAARHSGGTPIALWILLGLLVVVLIAALIVTVRFREPTGDQMLAELERALARSGRRLPGGTTLAGIEQRFRGSPDAQQYVRTLRLARYADTDTAPSPAGRRAVRAKLREGLGLSGLVRSLWALPPRVTLRRTVSEPPPQGLHSS